MKIVYIYILKILVSLHVMSSWWSLAGRSDSPLCTRDRTVHPSPTEVHQVMHFALTNECNHFQVEGLKAGAAFILFPSSQ